MFRSQPFPLSSSLDILTFLKELFHFFRIFFTSHPKPFIFDPKPLETHSNLFIFLPKSFTPDPIPLVIHPDIDISHPNLFIFDPNLDNSNPDPLTFNPVPFTSFTNLSISHSKPVALRREAFRNGEILAYVITIFRVWLHPPGPLVSISRCRKYIMLPRLSPVIWA